jgi:ankyrin repeat protein
MCRPLLFPALRSYIPDNGRLSHVKIRARCLRARYHSTSRDTGGHAEIAKVILECGADPNIRDDDGLTPLEIAKIRNDTKTAKIIEEYCKKG